MPSWRGHWAYGSGLSSSGATTRAVKLKLKTPKHLPLIEQIAVCAAGYTAETVFGYPTHYWIAAEDYNQIRKLLKDNAIPEEERGVALTLRKKGAERARACLETHSNRVIELAERLVEDGRIGPAEFLDLMDGATP